MIIALAGATGLTGHQALSLLLEESRVAKVVAIGRRATGLKHPKLEERLISEPMPFRADAYLCCLGTTIKKAGSRSAFAKVDVDLPLEIGRALHANGCEIAVAVSAIGADPTSPIFYLRAKGKMESGMREIGFKSLTLLRPSIISGPRREPRPAEQIGLKLLQTLAPLMIGAARKYRPIEAQIIARAMVRVALAGKPGAIVYESDALGDLRAP